MQAKKDCSPIIADNYMQKTEIEKPKAPFYYVKKRLFSNFTAMAGLVVILIACLFSLLGYLIMPDDTPNANDGAVQIAKKPPMFRAKLLKKRKHADIEIVSLWERMLFGQESLYLIVPITEYRIEGFRVYYKPLGRVREESEHLVNLIKPVYIGDHHLMDEPDPEGNFKVESEKVTYFDVHEKVHTVSRAELLKEFEANNIEERTYVLGTDKMGRDMLSRLLFGFRISLAIGLLSVVISFFLGITLGAMAGFFGGWIDSLIMWFMTVIWSIPSIMLVIAISLALGNRGISVVFVAVGLTTWVEIARLIRGQIKELKEKQFVEAARALGVKNYGIVVRHIFPNIIGTIIVTISANFASAILIEAGLSFLGLGVQPPMPSWGMMVNEGFEVLGSKDSTHMILWPSIFISVMVLAFNLLGNGLRDAYDPKTLLK